MKSIRLTYAAILISLLITLITGCGSSNNSTDEISPAGKLSLHITDAPVDEASGVVIEFTGIEIQPAIGERLDFNFGSPRQIIVSNLISGNSEIILEETTVPSGHYNWIRLKANAVCDALDSFIEINGVMHPLWIPSGNQTGLKLVRGFDIPAGGTADFTIDFDLRKSINHPQGQGHCSGNYKLKPALRIVDNTRVGSISGTVEPGLVNAQTCTGGNAVYVFKGHNVTPDDVDGLDPDPVTSAPVKFITATQLYIYKAAFLESGNYTAAFTCQARDDKETDDPVDFAGTANVTVSEGSEAILNFY